MPWYADGRLRLSKVTVDVPGIRALGAFDGGAVAADSVGRLLVVSDQGERTQLGTVAAPPAFAVSGEQGWVAWIDVGDGGGTPSLVVRDLTTRTELARRPVIEAPDGAGGAGGAEHAEVIAIDAGSVFFRDAVGEHELVVASGVVEDVGAPRAGAALLDVARRVRVYQRSSDELHLVPPLTSAEHRWPGRGAELSPDGTVAFTWVVDRPVLHDTRTGEELDPDVEAGKVVLDVTFGADSTVVYLLAVRDVAISRLEVRTCALGLVYLASGAPAPHCTSEYTPGVRVPEADGLLAHET